MYTGVKTKYFTMGYDSSIDHYDVNSMTTARKVDGLLTWAQEAGKNTGEEIKIPARSPTLPMHLLFFMCVVGYELPIKYVISIIFHFISFISRVKHRWNTCSKGHISIEMLS